MTINTNKIDGLWVATERHSEGAWYGIHKDKDKAIEFMRWHKSRDQAAQQRIHY